MFEYRKRLLLHPLAIVIGFVMLAPLVSAQDTPTKQESTKESTANTAPTSPPTTEPKPAATETGQEVKKEEAKTGEKAPEEKKSDVPSYYVAPKAYGTRMETEPPRYVKPLSQLGVDGLKDYDWLLLGVQQRTRWEYRDDDYRRNNQLQRDNQFLLRNRIYLGIKDKLDPLRFTLEFQDSRQFNSDFPENNQDVDENEILQAYAELYFKDALGKDRPLTFRAGRMTFDYVDRKLVARNGWRNTTNAFDGFLARLGQQSNNWQLDVFATQPVERHLIQPDHGDDERWFIGAVGAWRQWSKVVTLEPYYFYLNDQRKNPTQADRQIHTLGLRAYGPIGKTHFDYEMDGAFQFGSDGQLDQRALALVGELGYSFEHKWKPRLSIGTIYASGDHNPNDNVQERFDRLFGESHGYSATDYFVLQNTISPKLRLELNPTEKLRIDTGYGGFWLASDSDTWPVPGRRDRLGNSGDCVGHEWEARIRYQWTKRIELELGYSHFFQGPFVENTGPADDSDFFYVQTTIGL